MSFCLLLVITTFFGTSRQDSISPTSSAVYAKEMETIRISCEYKYTVSMNNLQWYRQYPNAKPEFLVLIMESGQNQTATPPHPRLTTSVDKDKKLVNLKIFPADVKDSAVYYCALQTGGFDKLIFGMGTNLIIETQTEVKPNVYKVGDSENSGCLATDFTKHNAFNVSGSPSAVRYSGQNYYSSFNFNSSDCKEKGVCSQSSGGGTDLEKDEKVNFLSLGIFWLRILFLKTVVFNVLVTFKAWMS